MSDYNLGTAHGRIIVDYDDKGPKVAGKDMEGLGEKAKNLVRNILHMGREWRATSEGLVNDTAKISRGIAYLAGGIAVLGSLTSSIGQVGNHLTGLRGGIGILSALGTTMGGLPNNVQGFPSIIKKIILLSAAITLLKASTGIIRTVFSRFLLLRGIGNIIGGLGDGLFRLAGPIRAIAGLALFVGNLMAATKIAMKLAKGVFVLNGALAALAVVLYVVAGAADAISQLSGLLGLLPGILLAAGLAAATLKIGLMGVADAIKSGDLKGLSQEAAQFVTDVRSMKDQWDDLKKTVQDKLFAGLGPQVKELGGIYLPMLKQGLAGIANQFNLAAKDAIAFFKTAGAQKDMKSALDGTTLIVGNLRQALAPLLQVFMDVAVVGISVLGDLTSGAGSAAERFAAMVREARETGKLKEWIQGGVQGFRDLWNILKNVYMSLKALFSGLTGGEGEGALAWLRDMTDRMRAFLESANTQSALRSFGTYIGTVLTRLMGTLSLLFEKLGPIISDLMPFIIALGDAFTAGLGVAITFLAPIFQWLAQVLSFLAPVLAPILGTLFAAKIIFLGLGVAATVLGGIISTLSIAWTVASTAAKLLWWATKGVGSGIAWLATQAWAGISSAAAWAWAHISAAASAAYAWVVAKVSMAASWLWIKIQAAASAIATGAVWLYHTLISTAATVAAWVGARLSLLGLWLLIQVHALASAIATGAAWLWTTLSTTASVIAAWVAARVAIIAGWITMAAGAVASAIGIAITWLTTQLPMIASIVAAWIGARIALIAGWIMMAGAALAGAASVALAWIIANLPLVLFIAAIAAVVALVIIFWDQIVAAFQAGAAWVAGVWQQVTGFFRDAMANISAALGPFAGILDFVLGPLRIAQTIIGAIIDTIKAIFSGNFAAIGGILSAAGSRILSIMKSAMTGMASAVGAGISAVLSFFASLPGRAFSALGNLVGFFARAGTNMISGIVNGLSGAAGRVISFLTGLAQRALNSVLSFFGIASPSKVFMWVSEMNMEGMIKGMRKMRNKVRDEALAVSAAVTDGGTRGVLGAAQKKAQAGSGISTTQAVATTWNPYEKPKGGDGANMPTSGTTFTGPMSVTIPAKDIAEMQSVTEFFDKVGQAARAGKATP